MITTNPEISWEGVGRISSMVYNNGSFTILTRITNCRISVAFSLRQLSRIEDIIKQMTKQAQIYDELLEEASGLRHQLWPAVQDTFTTHIR